MQSALGSRLKRVDKDDLIKGNLIFATVKSVNYQFQTAELEQSGAMNKVGSKGKFSVPIPREFIGRSPEGSLFGHSPLLAPGTKVLVGFVDGDRNSPVILSSYGKPSDNAILSPLPIKGGEFSNKGIYKYAGAIHKIFPSMTYEFIDGDGTQVKTYPGKTFLSIASKPDEKPSASDFYLGTSYSDLYSSRYGDEKLIEPRSQIAPNILFKHQGTHTAEGNEDTHVTMLGIDEKGAMRASVLDKKAGFRTTQEMDEKGNYRVVHQPNELILGETEDKLEFGINTESQTFYIRQGTKLYEFTDNGMTVDGKLPEDIIAEVVNNSEVGIINLIDDSERERGGEENPLYTIDLAPVFDLHGVDKPYSLSFELKTLSTKDRDDIKVYMGDGSSTKYSFVNKTVKASKEFTRITLEGIKPVLKDDSAKTAVLAFSGSFNNNNIPVVRMLKLEHGTKSSPWSPSNKDIESRVKVLGEEIVLDFADGIIDASELKRLKTHIEIMNRTYTDFEKRYEALINNPDFKDDSLKASLVTAKNDFNKKSQVLIDTLLKVISDGIIEAVESEDTQRAFKDYDNAVASLNTLIDDVIKTISVKIAGDLIADFEGVLGNVNSSIAKLQKQADGSIVTYYYSEDPTMFNKPAVEWDTEELKSMHVGDYYFNMSTGEAFEFFHDEKGYRWITNDNQAIVKALEKASKAQDTADHKRRVFVTTPIPPYEIGDMWTQGTDGDIKVCKITRLTGKYDPSDWGLASKYTDDSLASSALNVANTAQSNLDGFKKTVETVFRDGIIDEAESKQLQVHIDLMNRDKVELDNTYNKFMSDNEFTALPDSSKLSLAKGQYDLAFKELFNIFNTAVEDKIVMPEESVNVNRAMDNYNNKLSALKISFQNATQALVSVEASKQVKVFNGVIEDIINNYKELKIQADGVVNTYYYGYEPTINNIPASNWTTTTEKNTHLGDYFMDTASGKVYIYTERNGNFTWEALTNQAVVDAITSAKDAQDTADNKRRIFTDTPYPPYDIGDMWVQGVNGDIFVAKVSKTDNTEFLISDWVKASKYTDDTKANEAKAKADMAYNSALLGISQAQDAQQKATTAYNNFNTFETSTFKAYQDGVISDIEKAKLNSQLSIIEVDCNKVIASTDEYLSNQYLPSQFKTTLTTYKNGLATAFEKLKNIYTTIVSDNKVTKEELSQSSTVLSDYQTALLNLVKETEKSNLAISKALTDNSIATFNNNISAVIGNINDIKNQVDGSINTYFYGYEPMLSNEPASAWNTIELKDTHVGDYFTDLSTGRVYKFTNSGSTYKWTPETNQAIVKAMSDAKNAQDTADGKRRVFAVQPTPPYDAGDMWTQGENGDILVATVGRVKGTSFNQSDWTKASKYTDDAKAIEAQRVAGQALSSASAVANNFSIFKETTFSAYQDKVISDFEKAQMKTQLDAIESDNAVLLAQYTDILASKYLEDSIKVSLNNSKDLYVNAYSTLKSTINSAILNSKITASELETTRTAITNYTGKLAEFQVMIQKALANISDNTALNNIVSVVDKIEVGTVNLLEKSNMSKTQTPREHMYYTDILPTLNKVEVGDTLTVSFDVQMTKGKFLQVYNSNQRGIRYIDGKSFTNIGTNKQRLSFQAIVKEDTTKRTDLSMIEFYSIYDSGDFATVSNMKIEKGTKATGYNLAPEDYDNLIRDVRQETADVNDALGNFSNTVTTTFRDGIITETEAKKLTTSKKQLEREKAEMDSKYSALIVLPNIDVAVKNELEARKKVFDTTHKKSLDYMSSAIANKKISINEMNTLDNYLDEYKDNLSNLVISFEKVSDNNVDKKIDNLDLGVINLITTPKKKIYTESDISYKSPKSIVADGGWKEVTGVYSMPPEKDFVISGWAKIGSGTPGGLLIHPVQFDTETGTNRSASPVDYFLVGADWTYFEYKLKSAVNTKSGTVFIRVENTDSGNTILVNGLKLEMGTKATPWIPSHQDIDKLIQDVQKETSDITKAITNYEGTIGTTFKDNIITTSEAKGLAQQKMILEKDRDDLSAKYNEIYNNSLLVDTFKTNLATAKSQYDTSHSALLSSIDSAVSDKKTTASEFSDVSQKFNDYKTKLSILTTRFEQAIDSLSTTKANNVASQYSATINEINGKYDTIKAQADASINSYFYNYAPTLVNAPANAWTDNATKDIHIGDYFLDTSSGKYYTFTKVNTTYSWVQGANTAIQTALANASKAQGTADKKKTVFTTQPITPYDIGDMWTQGSGGDLYVCKVARTSGAYVANDWEKATKYTDDTKANQAYNIANKASQDLSSFWDSANGIFKDGVIDSNELPRLKSHLDTLDNAKLNLTTNVTDLNNNANLDTSMKNTLSSLQTTYNGAHKSLVDTLNVAISDKKVTDNEILDVSNKFSAYGTALSNLSTHIQKCYSNIADNIAKGRSMEAVNGLEIGTRNLIEGSSTMNKDIDKTWSGFNQLHMVDIASANSKLKVGDTVTLSFDVQMTVGTYLRIYDSNGQIDKTIGTKIYSNIGNNKQRLSYTTTLTSSTRNKTTWMLAFYNNNNGDKFIIENIKLEKGNKATDWSPAPEDITKEFNTARDNLSNFEKYVKESFKDGIIDSTELVRLRTHKETLERNKKNLDTRYKNIYNNSNLTDTTVKTALSSSYSTFVSKHDNLMSKFTSAISNGKITTQENEAVITALNDYDTALANLTTNIEKAIVSQGDSQLTQLTKLATTTSNNFADFKDNTFRTYSDNTLDTFEKQQLKAKLAVVTTNYKDLSKRYEDIVNHSMLSSEVKAIVTSKKTDFTKSYEALINSIDTLLKSTKLTPTITQPVDNAMDNYQTAMSIFTVELQKALNDISNNQAIAKAKEAVDSIVIGGNNILNNSDFSLGSKYWTTNGTASFETVDGYTVAKITNLSGAGIYQIVGKNIEDDYYILSFRAKAIGTSATIKVGMLNQGVGKISDFSIDNKWKTYSYAFTSPVNTSIDTYFHIYSSPQAQQGFYITQVQLEKGNKATDWALSLSDVEEKNNSKITNATSDWTKKLNDELSALRNTDSFPSSAIKVEALLVDKLMSQAQLTEKLVANNAFVNSLMANSIVTQKIQSTDIEAVKMRAVDKGSSINIEGGTLTFTKSDKSRIEMSIDNGIAMYNSVGKKIFGLDKTFAMASALGTSGANVYLAASLGYEVRTVDITKIPSDGAPGSYEYVPIRTLGIRSRPGDILPIGSDYGVFITSNTLLEGGAPSFKPITADGFNGNFLDINPLNSGVNVYIRPTKGGEVRITTTGTTGDYRPIKAQAFNNGSYIQYKKDIEYWDYDALSVIKDDLDIMQYRMNNDETQRLRRGVVVGGSSNTPVEFINEDSVDLYEMLSWALKSIQQVAVKIEKLEENIYGTTKP